ADHGLDSTLRQTSRKAAKRHVVEIVAHSGSLAVLHKCFRRAVAEGRQWLGAIPGHRLFLAARPFLDPADDLQHFAKASPRLRCSAALRTIKCFPGKTRGFGKL